MPIYLYNETMEAKERVMHDHATPVAQYLGAIDTQDLWDDIPPVLGSERVGYPTQRPLALLERIIKAPSNESDVVLDPFCVRATACVAAESLGYLWIGIDISPTAVQLVNIRLQQAIGSLFHNRLGQPGQTFRGERTSRP